MRSSLLMLVVVLACSCATISTRTVETMRIYGPGVIHHPVMVDLVVDEIKVSGSVTLASARTDSEGKQLAVAEALKQSGADVLVQPSYFMQNDGSQTTYTVTGFPAKYKNFRPMEPADVPLVQAGVLQKAQVAEPSVQSQPGKGKKGGGGWAAIGALLAVGAAIVLMVNSGRY